MGHRGAQGNDPSRRVLGAAIAALLACLAVALLTTAGSGARAATHESAADAHDSTSAGVLPCKRELALTAVYRINGKIRFEGVADASLAGKVVRVYEITSDEHVATTRIRRDGTWWANSTTSEQKYTWLTKFVAEAGSAQTRWRRLGQAVGIRGRRPVITSTRSRSDRVSSTHTRIQLKVSGDYPDDLVIGVQTGCSRYEVDRKFELRTNGDGVATITLPRPPSGNPFLIYRASTEDGLKISPPIVVKPGG